MCSEKQGNKFGAFLAFLSGGVIGSALGLLFAPMSGRKTRQKIRDASMEVKEKVASTTHRAKDVTTEKVTDLLGKGESTSRRCDGKCEGSCRGRNLRFCRKEVGTS